MIYAAGQDKANPLAQILSAAMASALLIRGSKSSE